MSQSLREIDETLRQAHEGYGILDWFSAPCHGRGSILGQEVKLSPQWVLLEERQRRGTGVPVDLGLSVLWSSRNVGAASGEQPGLYVGWGDGEGNLTSTDVNDYPVMWQTGIGGTDKDIARRRWAETWRLPTLAEMKELINKCRWQWTIINGVPGAQVMGPSGASIFLPAAGNRYGTEYEDVCYCGRYWTSQLRFDDDDFRQAHALEFSQMGAEVLPCVRHMGLCVRPVLEK